MNLLKRFFEEKEIAYELFEIEAAGTMHFIDTDAVIDLIFQSSIEEQQQIATILRQIDFKNGNVNHFLKHLATGFIMSQTEAAAL
jgi:hypothetical protein